MLIHISEKPVFHMESGETFGTLEGYVFHENKLAFLYCKYQKRYVYIPIEQVVLGQDAIMLKTNYTETLLSASVKPEVYTLEGKKIGVLSTIEFDEHCEIVAIKVDDHWIKKSDIVYIDHIVIIQSLNSEIEEGLQLQETSELAFINNDLSLPLDAESLQDSSIIHEPQEKSIAIEKEVAEAQKTVEEVALESEFITSDEINPNSSIDPRYSYLLGKRLLGNITVANKTFTEGIIIDNNLIELALHNNAIVKVIMNSED